MFPETENIPFSVMNQIGFQVSVIFGRRCFVIIWLYYLRQNHMSHCRLTFLRIVETQGPVVLPHVSIGSAFPQILLCRVDEKELKSNFKIICID